MSIIHEALKKVQANLQGQTQQQPVEHISAVAQPSAITLPVQAPETVPQPPLQAPQQPLQRPTQNKKPSHTLPVLAAMVILCGSLWFIYNQTIRYLPQILQLLPHGFKTITLFAPAKNIAPPLVNKNIQPLAQLTIPAATTTNNPAAPTVLNIQGIMANNGTAVALINNKIYEQGAEINGVKILNIGVKAITVLKEGKEETIQIQH